MLKNKVAERLIHKLKNAKEKEFNPIYQVVEFIYYDEYVNGFEPVEDDEKYANLDTWNKFCEEETEKFIKENINDIIDTLKDSLKNPDNYYKWTDLDNKEDMVRATIFRLAKEIWKDLEVLEEVTGTSDKKYEDMVIEELRRKYITKYS